ncbi:hypothetical protein [Tateyamaria sp.]|uniref:hypothetical protein n=1 Tax=Tateyamaria sp. TaxID=1929288 RepID=UPI00329B4083
MPELNTQKNWFMGDCAMWNLQHLDTFEETFVLTAWASLAVKQPRTFNRAASSHYSRKTKSTAFNR